MRDALWNEDEVSHLFNSVPGRRKFLKTKRPKLRLSFISPSFMPWLIPPLPFLDRGQTFFVLPHAKVSKGFARPWKGGQVPGTIEFSEPGLSLEGLIGKPNKADPREGNDVFVNRRPVNKTLSYAVLEAYHAYAPKAAILGHSLSDPRPLSSRRGVHP